jgi:hypothetical protein
MQLGTGVFIVYLIFGLYFLNLGFNLVTISPSASISSVISIICGILLVIGGIKFLRRNMHNYR